jgi:hypothetical protein
VLALLGDDTHPADAFPVDDRVNGYTNNASALRVSPLLAEQLMSTSESLATSARSRGVLGQGCNLSLRGESGCAQDFISSFGQKAFRRPITSAEQAGLFTVYQAGRSGGTHAEGLEWVTTAILQSGSFLYNTELGSQPSATSGTTALTPYELASAISYLITGGPPDDSLLAAAAQGALQGDALAAQVKRLASSPSAPAQLNAFFAQWLELDELDRLEKDAASHPTFGPELRASMKRETQSLIAQVLFTGEGTLQALLTDRRAKVDAPLAQLYGVPAPPPGELREVLLDATQRAGILTRAGLLATKAQNIDSSPIRRGKLVRTRVLCQPLPPPPETLQIVFPPQSATKTTRERFAQHATQACTGCHMLMDPVGFTFENFDSIGAFRATENGQRIDSSGELLATRDINGPVQGALELSRKLAASQEVQECFSQHLFQFVQARSVEFADECNLRPAADHFASTGGNVMDLLLHHTLSESFALREVVP